MEARLGKRRAGPGPPEGAEGRPLPRGLADPGFLLVLIRSSRDMLKGSDMFGWRKRFGEVELGQRKKRKTRVSGDEDKRVKVGFF